MSSAFIQLTGVVAALNLILGITVLIQGARKPLHLSFFFFAFFSSAWAVTTLIFQTVSPTLLVFQAEYAAGAAALMAAVIWTLYLTRTRIRPATTVLLSIIGALLAVFPFVDKLVIFDIVATVDSHRFVPGVLFDAYGVVLFLPLVFMMVELIRSTIKAKGTRRKQLSFVLLGIAIFSSVGIAYGVILPIFGIDAVVPFDVQSSLFWVGLATYAITRHQLLNVRVIATELFVFALWIFLLVRFLNAQDSARITEGLLLIFVVFVGVLLIKSVVNEVRRREEVERLNRQLGDFLRFGVHELRAPLGGIRGHTSMMLEGSFGELNDKLKRSVKIVHTQIDQLLLIVETFLNANRARSGNLEVVIQPTDLKSSVSSVLDTMHTKAELKKISLKSDIPTDLPAVKADPRKIQIVIGNVISNAIKYTLEGGITIAANVIEDKVVLKITDTGIGIPKDQIPRLFTQFERGSGEAKKMATGSGIGLYLTKKLMDAMDGEISITSAGADKGSTATLTFKKLNSEPRT